MQIELEHYSLKYNLHVFACFGFVKMLQAQNCTDISVIATNCSRPVECILWYTLYLSNESSLVESMWPCPSVCFLLEYLYSV